MILVLLGTQDKQFPRLLKEIDRLIEKKVIKDKVIAQVGITKYNSNNMEMFDLIEEDKLNALIKKADLIITHGGVGSILLGINNNKKVIAVPRLYRYKEHVNNHQKEIINEFKKDGYIVGLNDLKELEIAIKNIDKFNPNKYKSNSKIIDIVKDYIDNNETNNKKIKEIIMYLIFGFLTTFISLLVYYLLVLTIFNPDNSIELQVSNIISWVAGVLFAYITNRKYVFESKNKNKLKEACNFTLSRTVTLIIDMLIMGIGVSILSLNDKILKIFSQIAVIILNYVFSKIFVFKKEKK